MSGVRTTGMRVMETAPSTMNEANTIRIGDRMLDGELSQAQS